MRFFKITSLKERLKETLKINAFKNETETGMSEKKRLETGMPEERNAKGSGKLPGINTQK